jgi:uncharacterized protein YbjT (DUF2867 family)
MTKIAVAGSTGRLGRHVVDVLEEQGHDVVRISRTTGVDVITAEGLAEALEGVESVVDAASWPTAEQEPATEFFKTSAANLQAYGERAGVRRIVVVSIIGADRFSAGFIASKIPHERAHLAGPIPVRLLRAAQFHDFVELLMEWGRRDGVIHVPNMRTQLVSARTVAEALAELATDPEPIHHAPIPEIAGPRAEELVEIARLVAARRGDPARIEGVSDPADPDRDLLESGGLLPGPHATLAGPTFDEWFDAKVPA